MKYIIGVDGGTQSTKTTVYDLQGNIICSASVKLRPAHLAPGGVVEHPDDDLYTTLCSSLKELLCRFPGKPDEIAGLGLCSIRFCRTVMKEDGTLAQPVMNWMDDRVGRPFVRETPDARYVAAASGYLSRRLTGRNRDTAANYLGAWPFNRDTWNWEDSAIPGFGVTRDMLFDLVMPGELLGTVTAEAAADTGLPEGLPVFATANDKAVEALGVGCVAPGTGLLSLGTYIAAMICSEKNNGDGDAYWTNLASIPGRYFYETNGVRRGMWMLSWWSGVIGEDFAARAAAEGVPPEELLNREAACLPAGSDGLMVVPDWLAPASHPFRKGMMLGFDGRHGRGHIYRAILEGIALTMRGHIEAADALPERIWISGGGSKSDVFMQIFADVLNIPVLRPGENGSAGLGAAICAAVGLGLYPDFDAAAAAMCRPGLEFRPIEENVETYNRMYPVYSGLTGYGDPVFRRSFELFG